MARDGQLGTDGSGIYSYLSPVSPVSPSLNAGDSRESDPVQADLD
jgi:hypothetical protein